MISKSAIDKNIKDFRDTDPMTYEDAYHFLESVLEECKEEMLNAYAMETTPSIRGRFIEFLGLYKDESLIPLLKTELERLDNETIPWALGALNNIDTIEANRILSEFKKAHPQFDF